MTTNELIRVSIEIKQIMSFKTIFIICLSIILLRPSTGFTYPLLKPGEAFIIDTGTKDSRDQLNPSVAFDGEKTFLVVWQQGRQYHEQQTADIFGVRVDNNGNLLDKEPIHISTHSESQENPQVIFSNNHFMVVWQDFRNKTNWDIYGTRISPQGKVIETNGIPIATGEENQTLPSLSSSTDGFLVIWQHYSENNFYQLATAMMSTSGKIKFKQILEYSDQTQKKYSGYTPGWGNHNLPLTFKHHNKNALYGGNINIISMLNSWVISWNDETNWSPGTSGANTRRFALLKQDKNKLHVKKIRKSPSLALGTTKGSFSTDGKNIMFAGSSKIGRSNHFATASLFSNDTLVSLPNPNQEPARLGSGWDPKHTILVFGNKFQSNAHMTVTYNSKLYVFAATGHHRSKQPYPNRIYASRITGKGKRLGNIVLLHEGSSPPANPTLVSGQDGFLLLTFEQENNSGLRKIWIKPVLLEQN